MGREWPIDGRLFSEVDPETYAELRRFLAEGTIDDHPYHFVPDTAERKRLFEIAEHLRVGRAHNCGQAECRTYAFMVTESVGKVIEFAVPGLAYLMLNENGEIFEYERLLWVREDSPDVEAGTPVGPNSASHLA
jgi:hypothetical protein